MVSRLRLFGGKEQHISGQAGEPRGIGSSRGLPRWCHYSTVNNPQLPPAAHRPMNVVDAVGNSRAKNGHNYVGYVYNGSFQLKDASAQDDIPGVSPAARGCSSDGRKMQFMWDLPLRGAARLMD